MEPSCKVGMFFDSPWWLAGSATYPAKLSSYLLTPQGYDSLASEGFPEEYLNKIAAAGKPSIINTSYSTKAQFLEQVEQCIEQRLSIKQQNALFAAAELDTIGPSITDMPIRQVVYFGNNELKKKGKKVYGILASYDDIQYTTF
jgi:hypothetical protein